MDEKIESLFIQGQIITRIIQYFWIENGGDL
jgi:hypothetical protein